MLAGGECRGRWVLRHAAECRAAVVRISAPDVWVADAVRAELIQRGIKVSEVDELQGAASSSSPTPTARAGSSSSCPTGRRARATTGSASSSSRSGRTNTQ